MKKLMAFLKDEEGATAIEYGLMAAAIAAVIIVTAQALGTQTSNVFQAVANAIAAGV